MVLVVREEADGSLRRYCHIGTGNYHPKTARLYEDFGLLTCRPDGRRGHHRPVQPPDRLQQAGPTTAGCWSRRPGCARGCSSGSSGQDGGPGRASRPGSRSSATRIIDEAIIDALYRASQPAFPSTCGYAGSARCARACPGCRRTSGSAASSAGSSSTRGSTRSAPTGRRRRGLDRQRRPDAPQPRPAGRAADPGDRSGTASRAARTDQHGDGSGHRRGGWPGTAPGPGITSMTQASHCWTSRST